MLLFLVKNKNILFFCIATFLTEIGMGLTQVSVYGMLSSEKVSTFIYGVAFFLTLFPGFIATLFVTNIIKKIPLHRLFIVINTTSSFFLFFPLYGSYYNNIYIIISALIVSSFSSGFLFTIIQTYIKKTCKENNLILYSKIDSLLFTANIFIGVGLGSLLYPFLGSRIYIIMNIIFYIISSILVYICFKVKPECMAVKDNNIEKIYKFNLLNSKQKKSLLFTPFLCFITTPLITLLPLIGRKYGINFNIFEMFLSNSVTSFLFAKSLGQLIGPSIMKKSLFHNLLLNYNKIIFLIMVFVFCYLISYFINSFYISILLIIIAHISSNILTTLGFYIFQKEFSEEEVVYFSSIQYRITIIVMSLCSIMSPILYELTNFILISFLPLFILLLLFLVIKNIPYKKKYIF